MQRPDRSLGMDHGNPLPRNYVGRACDRMWVGSTRLVLTNIRQFIQNPTILVDVSHDNCIDCDTGKKDHTLQGDTL